MNKRFRPDKFFFSQRSRMESVSVEEQLRLTGGEGDVDPDPEELGWEQEWNVLEGYMEQEGEDGGGMTGEDEDNGGWEDGEDEGDGSWEDGDGEDGEDEGDGGNEDGEEGGGQNPGNGQNPPPGGGNRMEEVEVIGYPEDEGDGSGEYEDEDWREEEDTWGGEEDGDGEDGDYEDEDWYGGDKDNVNTKENEPCEGIERANELKSNSSVSTAIDAIKNSSTEIGHKFFVGDPSDYNTFNVGEAIPGSGTQWSTNFTWNATGGYAIGHLHNHPSGSAPSPSDAMRGIKLDQMQDEQPGAVDFYTKNFSAVVVSGSHVYTITIADAELYKTHQGNFNDDGEAANDLYKQYIADYGAMSHNSTVQEAGEYALLKMYGDSINLTRQGINQTDSNRELKLNSAGNSVISSNPCSPK